MLSKSNGSCLNIARKALQIGALQKVSELRPFLEIVKRQKPKKVIEIGTARGGTLYALCQVSADDATIVSIDLPGGPFGGGYSKEDIEKFKTFKKPRQTLHFLRKNSHEMSTVQQVGRLLGRKSVDVLLIDGDHSYSGVKTDWDLYSPLVKDGGLICLHDIVFHQFTPECQVDRLWMEIRTQHKSEVFIDPHDFTWGGIGLIYHNEKPSEFLSIEKANGILLDISPIPTKQPKFLGMANRKHPNVEVLHDLEDFPWPFKNDSVHILMGHNIIQKIKPWCFIPFMDEVWRIMKPGGQVAFSTPYPGSQGYYSDPLNCNPVNEHTFYFFDPTYLQLYQNYEPKPWMIEPTYPQWTILGSLEIALRPRK